MNNSFNDETGDIIRADLSNAKISYDGEGTVNIKGDKFRAEIANADETDGGYVEQLFLSGSREVKAAIAAADTTIDAAGGANFFQGDKSAVDFTDVVGDVFVSLRAAEWANTIDGEQAAFRGITEFIGGQGKTSISGSDDNETLRAGLGETSHCRLHRRR